MRKRDLFLFKVNDIPTSIVSKILHERPPLCGPEHQRCLRFAPRHWFQEIGAKFGPKTVTIVSWAPRLRSNETVKLAEKILISLSKMFFGEFFSSRSPIAWGLSIHSSSIKIKGLADNIDIVQIIDNKAV